jgi:phage host-nuclease inhibitor protein Gam
VDFFKAKKAIPATGKTKFTNQNKITLMATRIKKKIVVNVTLEQAQEASELYAVNSNKLAKLEAKMNEELNKVKSKYADEITSIKEQLEEPFEVLQAFAEEQKNNWGKRKSFDLLHCLVGFRTGTPKVTKDKKFTWDAVVELMKKNRIFKGFIRTTEEINKEAILSERNEAVLNQLKEECYVSVTQDESFYVEPKIEEVSIIK